MLLLTLATLVLSLTGVALVQGQMPIPKRPVGFVYEEVPGQSNAACIHLDVYIDLTCPDSKGAWPVVMEVARHYGPRTLKLTTHLFPLPYHRGAWYTAKAGHVISELTNGRETYNWIDTAFQNQDDFTKSALFQLTDDELVQNVTRLANQLIPNQIQQFQRDLLESRPLEMDTRVGWKYSCTRGVASTPTFMVNDVVVDAAYDWTLADWLHIVDPLLS